MMRQGLGLLHRSKYLNAILFFFLCTLIISSVNAYGRIHVLLDAQNRIIHAHRVIDSANQLLLPLTEAEARISYFLISNDKQEVVIIPQLMLRAEQRLRELQGLIKNFPAQQTNIIQLEQMVMSQITFIHQLLNDSLLKGKANALQTANTPKSQITRQQIVNLLQMIKQEELNVLQKYNIVLRNLP
jgi:CHASE3 domain sensor protein